MAVGRAGSTVDAEALDFDLGRAVDSAAEAMRLEIWRTVVVAARTDWVPDMVRFILSLAGVLKR